MQKTLASLLLPALLLALCALALYEAKGFASTIIEQDVGAGAFPTFYAYVLGALAVVYAFVHGGRSARQGNEEDLKAWPKALLSLAKPGLALALVALYAGLLAPLGYLFSTALFLCILMRVLGSRSWLKNALLSALFSALLWLIFAKALQVPLPTGDWLDWL